MNILKQLFFTDDRLHNDEWDSEHMAVYVSKASMEYLSAQVDSEIYFLEVCIAMFMDPRQKSLNVLNAFWSSDENRLPNVRRKFKTVGKFSVYCFNGYMTIFVKC